MPYNADNRMDFRGQPEIARDYGMTGTEPVTNRSVCQYMLEDSITVEVEWYRDENDLIASIPNGIGAFLFDEGLSNKNNS